MYYIGIDLAWTYKNDSGIAILDDEGALVFCHAKNFTDEEIIELIKEYSPSIISIDSPLQVKNDKGGRSVDSELMKRKINSRHLKLYATSRGYMMRTFGCIRGENLLEMINSQTTHILGTTIFETYPTGIYLSLFPEMFDNKYKLSSRLSLFDIKENARYLINAINKLGFTEICEDLESIKTKVAYKKTEDRLDAILCAINSYYIEKKSSLILGDACNGIISLPLKD